jgi:cysteine dioxygenase
MLKITLGSLAWFLYYVEQPIKSVLDKITTVESLVDDLERCQSKDEYAQLIKYIDLPLDELAQFAYWDEECYTRNCIERTEDYELLLLCWDVGQVTPIHCHNAQECWVYVAQGELAEVRYKWDGVSPKPIAISEGKAERGNLSYMNDAMGYHTLENIGEGRAMSLHLYVKAIDECTIWDDTENAFITKQQSYHTVGGEVLV